MDNLQVFDWIEKRVVDNTQDFNMLALIWPIGVIIFLIFFFRVYRMCMQPRQNTRKRTVVRERRRLSFLGTTGRMTRLDWILALALTFLYSILAFSFSGNSSAPQSFWRATQAQPSLTMDLGEEVQLVNILYYTGVGDRVKKFSYS